MSSKRTSLRDPKGKNRHFGRGLKNREELEARIKPAHCYVG
jgi:hypothetical protein